MKNELCIPKALLSQHAVVLGKTGKGKSSALRHLVEHLLTHKKRVCIIDPKGDWWGLKSSADGKGPGFPVIAFGDFKDAGASDVPITAQSGKHVAELIATGNRPCMIGFRGWMPGQMIKFWLDFAPALFNLNAGELYLIGDEFHNFAPKGKILDPAAGQCLHWSNRIMSEGRGVGLICLIASQRPQKVHNDTLTCCETLIAMGVNHPADRDAVKDWIDGCGDAVKGREVLNALAGLPRGQAYVWSPENKFGPELITFPLFETFDSFAPPQLQRKVSHSGWADVNLEEVKQKLATVIEEAKANDPAALKQTIRELRAQIAKPTAPVTAPPAERIEIPILTPEHAQLMDRTATMFDTMMRDLDIKMEEVREIYRGINTMRAEITTTLVGRDSRRAAVPHKPVSLPVKHRTVTIPVMHMNGDRHPRNAGSVTVSDVSMDEPKQKILTTIAMLNARELTPNREMLARWMGIHPNGGRYGTNLAALRAGGYLGGCELTGLHNFTADPFETGFEALKKAVDGPCGQILDILASGNTFTRETLAEALGIHPNGGRYGTNLALLRTMGVITERGPIKLTEAANL